MQDGASASGSATPGEHPVVIAVAMSPIRVQETELTGFLARCRLLDRAIQFDAGLFENLLNKA